MHVVHHLAVAVRNERPRYQAGRLAALHPGLQEHRGNQRAGDRHDRRAMMAVHSGSRHRHAAGDNRPPRLYDQASGIRYSKMKQLLLLSLALLLAATLALAGAASAQETRIAAVVNDDVISIADVTARMRLVFASSNIEDTPESRQRVARQVVRILIDEKLQMQEAKRLNLKVSDEEIAGALGNIEAQNKLPKGGLDKMLAGRGIERGTLVDQLTATLAWGKVVRQNLNRVTPISDEEIDAAIARQRETAHQPRARVAEIFLAVSNPQQDEEVHRFADQLFEQLRQGAHFPALAQQFSQSATAAVGGDIGWVSPSQLANEIGSTVEELSPRQAAPPGRAAGGYYLILVLEKQAGGGTAAEDTPLPTGQATFP